MECNYALSCSSFACKIAVAGRLNWVHVQKQTLKFKRIKVEVKRPCTLMPSLYVIEKDGTRKWICVAISTALRKRECERFCFKLAAKREAVERRKRWRWRNTVMKLRICREAASNPKEASSDRNDANHLKTCSRKVAFLVYQKYNLV